MTNHSSISYMECANETEGMVNIVIKNCLLQERLCCKLF